VSIQPNRVVARIVDEVARSPRPTLPFVAWPSGAGYADEQIGTLSLPAVSSATSFATLFHFWTHGLRAFLELHRMGDQLAGAAGYAMCEQLSPAALDLEIAALAQRLPSPPAGARPFALAGKPVEAYRMIDGPCRHSLVAATESHWWASFRCHGRRVPLRLVC